MTPKKQPHWLIYLLLIPLQFALDVIMLLVTLGLDDPASRVFFLSAVFLAWMTAVVVTWAIDHAAAVLLRRRRAKRSGTDEGPVRLAPKQCWIALPVQGVLYAVTVIGVGSYEINSFYARPDHVGFAIPIVSLILAVFFFLVFVFAFFTCLCHARKARRAKAEPPDHTCAV